MGGQLIKAVCHTRTLVAYLLEEGTYPAPETAKTRFGSKARLSSNSWPSLTGAV